MELNKFCTPNGRDDLCLFFGLHTSSLRVILELSVHYNFLQRVTSVTRHSNFSFGKFSLFSLSSCKYVGCPQKKKESRTLFFPVPIRIPDWFRTFRSEYFHWMATWQSEQCLDFAVFYFISDVIIRFPPAMLSWCRWRPGSFRQRRLLLWIIDNILNYTFKLAENLKGVCPELLNSFFNDSNPSGPLKNR